MDKEKRIEEMSRVITCVDLETEPEGTCCRMNFDQADTMACALYNAGYRKQSEGEWVPSDIPQEKYVCSVCGGACWYYDFQGDVAKSRYCPNCGAHMKGGAE